MVLGKLGSDMQKNEPGPLSYTVQKNKLKMDERPKCKIGRRRKQAKTSLILATATSYSTLLLIFNFIRMKKEMHLERIKAQKSRTV